MDKKKTVEEGYDKIAKLLRGILVSIAIVCSPIGLGFIALLQVAPLPVFLNPPASLLNRYSVLLIPPWLAIAVGSHLFLATAILSKRMRRHLPNAIILWVTFWVCLPLGSTLISFRGLGLERVTERAQLLIEAIGAYHIDEGEYPAGLQALVPEYIDKIPYTGAVGYPDYEYEVATDGGYFKTYEIRVQTPPNFWDRDIFIFWPEENYPAQIYGGNVRLIGDWVYISRD